MLVQAFKIEDHSVGSVFFGSYKNRRDNLPWFMTGFNNSCLLKQVCDLFRNDTALKHFIAGGCVWQG